jgi:hypothetical protein
VEVLIAPDLTWFSFLLNLQRRVPDCSEAEGRMRERSFIYIDISLSICSRSLHPRSREAEERAGDLRALIERLLNEDPETGARN